ncbi:alternate-type signal peptide domain-containing protein [Rhodococcus sp. 1R11]|uniref:alternate-type signal peptide domain-containing protein n=1 Tax=Rhodococcus sp. 1R11 TaxID=2559614 RepID=UPI0014308650|nr:alternate-type signal peptide domain-containing protein [Rhodococcus sp. 1R11]
MNKATKGSLAAGAAVVLLLGGAGSYALWSDTETLPLGPISTGVLKLEPVAAGVWTDVSPIGPKTDPVTIGSFNLVPGDVLSYDATYRVDAEGNNLQATLVPDAASITYGTGISATEVTVALATTIGGQPIPNVLTSANNGNILTVKVLVTFNAGTELLVGQDTSVNLANFRVVLQQTRTNP